MTEVARLRVVSLAEPQLRHGRRAGAPALTAGRAPARRFGFSRRMDAKGPGHLGILPDQLAWVSVLDASRPGWPRWSAPSMRVAVVPPHRAGSHARSGPWTCLAKRRTAARPRPCVDLPRRGESDDISIAPVRARAHSGSLS